MDDKKYPGRFTIAFNLTDERQRAASEELRRHGRRKARFLADAILLGQNVQTTPEVIHLTERLAQEFILDLLSALRERQLELRSGQIVFVGGGSILLRRQIESSGKVVNPIFVDDINANAKGYELLYQLGQK